MKTIFFKKLRSYILVALTLFVIAQTPATAYSAYGSYSPTEKTVEDIIAQAYKHLNIIDTPGKHAQTQTLAYLDKTDLRTNLNASYSYKIKEIGIDYFKDIFKTILKNECDFKDTHHVFYHGQKREFILPQDLYNELNKIAYKKSLQDFILLRTPDKDFSKFSCIKDFLAHYIKNKEIETGCFDHNPHINKNLLAANPSLFSNTYNLGECSFYYFINSNSIASIDILKLAENVFNIFNYKKYFSKYNKEIKELNSILSESEKGKTGALLQIFIPEKMVNTFAYRCQAFGCLYHTDKKPEKHPAVTDLNNYKNGPSSWTGNSSFDNCQFRLLINQTMLDPNSGIKFFRYCNQTDTMKKYKAKLKDLCDKIAANVQAER
ncbi:MAG: hypothetical protein ABH827_04255 [bacterium]